MPEAMMHVSKQLLVDALRLPVNTYIRCVSDYRCPPDTVTFIVQHPDIKGPETGSIDNLPVVLPELRRQDEIVFLGWGQE